MTDLSGARVLVAGAGVLGSAVALALARAGASVTLVDPEPPGSNASAIAAGMLAPAFEAALDPASFGRFSLFAAARDLWPDFAADLGRGLLHQCGAIFMGAELAVAAAHERLLAEGARAERRGATVFTGEDWRIDPARGLPAMQARFAELGGRFVKAALDRMDDERAGLSDGQALEIDAVVLACGFAAQGLAPELAALSPVKGQLIRFPGAGPTSGAILRGEGGYLVPGEAGATAGATMEPGLSDTRAEPQVGIRLRQMAAGFSIELAQADFTIHAGVRASTPDALPMVGASRRPKTFLAAGARRNGWLLAPLVAAMLVDQMGGGRGGDYAEAFRPTRFGPGGPYPVS